MRRNEIEVGRIYVLGHRDGRFCDVYIRPVAVNGLNEQNHLSYQKLHLCKRLVVLVLLKTR